MCVHKSIYSLKTNALPVPACSVFWEVKKFTPPKATGFRGCLIRNCCSGFADNHSRLYRRGGTKIGQQFFTKCIEPKFFPFMNFFVAMMVNRKNFLDASRIICGIAGFALPAIRHVRKIALLGRSVYIARTFRQNIADTKAHITMMVFVNFG